MNRPLLNTQPGTYRRNNCGIDCRKMGGTLGEGGTRTHGVLVVSGMATENKATVKRNCGKARTLSGSSLRASATMRFSCWIQKVTFSRGTPARSVSKDTEPTRSSGSIFPLLPPDALASGPPDADIQLASKTGVFEDDGWRFSNYGSLFWANVVITAMRNTRASL